MTKQYRARVVSANVQKSANSEKINAEHTLDGLWLAPPTDLRGLKQLVVNSSILPQCIRAYKNNIAGFGIGVRYKNDYDKETPKMIAEYEKAEKIISLLNMDMDVKELFEDIVETREIYGIAYLEVIRNLAGEVTSIELIKHTPTIQKSVPLAPYVNASYNIGGETVTRPKLFCKYKQEVNANTVYFREFGDKRKMDKRTGKYEKTVPLEYQANEILEFAIGTEAYGEVRWLGQILGIDGSRRAEALNNRYFKQGRHTPLMLLCKSGKISDEGYAVLQQHMNDIEGERGQHSFILVEAEQLGKTDFDTDTRADIEVVKLADILQKDELFQEYLDNNRRRVQSAFQLPDIYVGYTTDFNRATAQSAREVTEEQVFQPERKSLAWIINNKLLSDYGFKYIEAYFKAPELTNPDDITKILNVTERAGGLTPNIAKDLTFKILGGESENYECDWGDIPLAYQKLNKEDTSAPPVEKSDNTPEIVAVMKEVRRLLESKGGGV